MARFSLKSSVKGVLVGAGMTGGWLLADLLLPEPWGDFLLFGAMAVVNIGICWRLGKFYDAQNGKEQASAFDANQAQAKDVRT